MQRQKFASLIRFSCVLSLSVFLVMLGGLLKPEAAVRTASFGAKGDFRKGSNPVSSASTAAQFSQQGPKLVGTGAVGNPQQGESVSLSADGNTAIVGGEGDNGGFGAAWIWTRSGGVWTQQGTKLVGSGAVGHAGQGVSVNISADGNTAIVGGSGDTSNTGAAWVFTRSGGVWTQQGTKLVGSGVVGGVASQGRSVSLSADGNTAIVGGNRDAFFVGAGWVWTRSGGVWTQQGTKLVGSGVMGETDQGVSVSLSADGNTAIIGGVGDNSFVGAAWVWTRSGGVWTQQGTKLVGSGVVGSANQGVSVSLSAEGNTAIVGGPGDDSTAGAAWVWTRSGGVWTQQGNKLVGSGAVGSANQGRSVSLSADGNTAIVGGIYDNSTAGAAWIWTRSGGAWTQRGTKLVGSGAVGNAQQGASVSLSADGNTAIVGGIQDNANVGAAWVFTASPSAAVDLGTLGGSRSFARAVNDNGMVVGESALPGNTVGHAFAWTQAGGMVDLGALGGSSFARAVNDNGRVAGYSYTSGDTYHAFAWTQAGGMVDLGTLGGTNSSPLAVNNNGMVVGESYTLGNTVHAFVWTQAGGMVDLGTLGGTFSRAWAVNDNGVVVGQSHLPGDIASHAFMWTQAGGMFDLGTLGGSFSESRGVNNNGMVVGYSSLPGDPSLTAHAFAWTQAGGMVDLGTLGGSASTPSAVNDNGMVVGGSATQGPNVYHSFVWTNAGGMVDLGTMGGIDGGAAAVNVSGVVVGSNRFGVGNEADDHGFVWTQPGGMLDLGYGRAAAVNNSGMIVGASWLSPDGFYLAYHATLWLASTGPPSIDAISPAVPVRRSTDQSLVVAGSGFQQNLTVTLTFPSGASTTLTGAQIQNVTPNSFTMLATLNASGSWSLRVNNPDGGQSNTFSFTVGSGPLISSVSPPSPVASVSNQNIPVFGSGFQPNLSVSVTFPNGTSTTLSGPGQIQNVTPTSFTMVTTLNATGTWRIRVNNPNGGGQSNTYNFTVRAAAPTITNVNPDPATAGVDTALIVSGINFRTGFSASVTTPDGTSNISSSQLTFISSTEIHVQVTMHGTPQYQATLKIFYSNGQSTTGTFQVQGTSSTGPLTGTIGIWDGQKVYKLLGASVTLQVYARLSSDPLPPISSCNPNCPFCPTCSQGGCIPATISDSQYSFASNSFLPNTDYDIYVDLSYHDVISTGVNCTSSNSLRTTRLVKRGYRASAPNSQFLDFDFKPPLVMVHGIWSCFTKWHNTLNDDPNDCEYSGNDPTYWESYARSIGFITFTPSYDYNIDANSGNGFSDWENRASDVGAQIINNFAALTGDNSGDYPPWIYVGHSQGGLIARVLTNKSGDANKPLVRRLKRLYLLGTPNSGSYLAGLGRPVEDITGRPFVEFLSEAYIRKTFNDRYNGFGFFPSSLVKAYAGNKFGAFGDRYVLEDSVSKIILRVDTFLFPDVEITLLELNKESLHFEHTELGGADSRDCIFINRILPDICSLPGGQSPSSTVKPCPVTSVICNPDVLRPDGVNRTQTGGASSTQASIITSQRASLASNQTITIPFAVSATDSILVNGFVSSGSASSFSLINPSGQVIDFASLPPTDGEHITGEFGQAFFLNNPVSGSWSLRATAGSSGATIAMTAVENSPLGFEGSVTPNIFTGQTAHLLGKWIGNQTGITSPLITAQIINESGTEVATVNLFDDGNHGDNSAGDGVFGGDTPTLSTVGGHSIIFAAQGNSNGLAFSRWAEALLDVVTPTHTLTGSFSDAAIDSDLDGAYDIIRETVGISVASTGGYLVTGDLYDAQGYFINHAVGYVQATSGGIFSVDLDFNVSGATCGQFVSPFSIRSLTVSDAGSLKVLDIYDQDPSTQTYDGSLFSCANGTPVPTITSAQPAALFQGGSGQVIVTGNSFANGAQFSFGPGVTISSVTLGSSSVLLVQVSVSQSAVPGPRDVTVSNPDGHSSTGIALFNVASDQPPAVSINNVADQQVVGGTVTISASASDDLGVQKVEFYVDGVLSGTDTSFPYQLVWDTTSLLNGSHTLAAKAYDTGNQNATAQITAIVSCVSSYVPTSQSFPAAGGSGAINVNAGNGCSWTVASNASWITIISGGGSGNGTVSFSVDANTGPTRSGTIAIASQSFTVAQDSGCSFSLDTMSQDFGLNGGTGGVNVTCNVGCVWGAISNDQWIAITSGPSGSGNGTVNYSVASNSSGNPRTGTMTIAGKTFTVNQSGVSCSFSLGGSSNAFSPVGGTGGFSVTTTSTCNWTATSNDSWLVVTSGGASTGSGNVNYSVDSNLSVNTRTGSITAGGQTFTVNQSGIAAVGLSSFKNDFDSDGRAELGFYRAGLWGFLKSSSSFSTGTSQFFSWGGSGLQPIVADFDGDSKADLAYMVPPSGGQSAAYAILRSTTGYGFGPGQPLFVAAGFPSLGDTPVVGDVDADGQADPGIWRASQGVWIIPKSGSNYTTFVFSQWGQLGDIPVVADIDGDGKADLGFYRDGLWGFLKSSQSYSTGAAQFFSWGGAGLQPIVGDFDGDGKADIGYMVPPSGGESAAYAILKSSTGYSFAPGQPLFVSAGFPSLGDTPVVGDFDGDGKADPGIWRESQGVWIIPLSSANYASYVFSQWGQSGDIAFPNTSGRH